VASEAAAAHCVPEPVDVRTCPLLPVAPPDVRVPVIVRLETVGLVPNTREPEPVSSVKAVARLAEDGVVRNP
jgi:hypothetical protein